VFRQGGSATHTSIVLCAVALLTRLLLVYQKHRQVVMLHEQADVVRQAVCLGYSSLVTLVDAA
jgi:hypothetical protein